MNNKVRLVKREEKIHTANKNSKQQTISLKKMLSLIKKLKYDDSLEKESSLQYWIRKLKEAVETRNVLIDDIALSKVEDPEPCLLKEKKLSLIEEKIRVRYKKYADVKKQYEVHKKSDHSNTVKEVNDSILYIITKRNKKY
ncbi:hypothetical protein [Sulfuricurvum sp.]|uniref:hypothetical protein n=1 Tax=Sulfuricurvum sp. TaxID=2025608 RepID=UPI003BAED837